MGTKPHVAPDYDELVEAETATTPHEKPHPVEVVVVSAVQVEDYPARTIISDQVPVGAVAQRVAGVLRTRSCLTICPRGADVYVGNETVTTGSGYLVKQDTTLTLAATDSLYAISAGSAIVHTLSQLREG